MRCNLTTVMKRSLPLVIRNDTRRLPDVISTELPVVPIKTVQKALRYLTWAKVMMRADPSGTPT